METMDDEHSEFIRIINNNPEILKNIITSDKALANMLSDMIKIRIDNPEILKNITTTDEALTNMLSDMITKM